MNRKKKCFVVPGNHDCFNAKLVQHNLHNYEKFFPSISGCSIEKTQVRGTNINVHLYNSTYDKGGFAGGMIPVSAFQGWQTDGQTLDVAVVHHHLAQSPSQKRQHTLELINVDQFVSFLLSKDINCVLFGHTHESFFEKISADILRQQIAFHRRWPKWLRRLFPRYFSKPSIDSLSFSRTRTKNGRFPSFDKYFEYLYIKNILRKDINGPELFEEPRHFYDHIRSYRSDYHEQLSTLRKKKVAFSMSPSPTAVDEDLHGFHVLTFNWDGSKYIYGCEIYLWDGADFVQQADRDESLGYV